MLRARTPAKPREQMKENERWAGYIVFLTVTSAIAAALIAGLAAIFADPSKIPSFFSKGIVLLAALAVLITLVLSVYASVQLSNYLVWYDQWSASQRKEFGDKVSWYSGAAFIALLLGAGILFIFLLVALFVEGPATPVGPSGKDGVKADANAVVALLLSAHAEQLRGPRGLPGKDGKDGASPTVEDVSTALIKLHGDQVRGPAGPPGKDGKDGASPTIEDVATALIKLHGDQVRGPAGPPGKDGKDGASPTAGAVAAALVNLYGHQRRPYTRRQRRLRSNGSRSP